jgi:hypothetical protein
MATEVYGSSSINGINGSSSIRSRRTKAGLSDILRASQKIINEEKENGKITIRHLFYRLVGVGLLAKNEHEYRHLSSYLMKWRRSGEISWSSFADNTRWYYGSRCFSSMEAALRNTRDTYRRNVWASQNDFVEIWCEKDAIASIILEEADTFGVRVFPLRGFSSGSSLHNAADGFRAQIEAGKNVYIYYFGDHDPSGLAIDDSTVRNLKKDHGVEVNFERIAVLPEHIEEYKLPTRPSKKSDSRTKKFQGESVEIDAMPMDVLRQMVRDCIIQHINPQEWAAEMATEKEEQATLNMMMEALEEVV